MKREFPQFRVIHIDDLDVEFIGTLQVKPEFPQYTVSILYRQNRSPLVKVIHPILVDKPPHFYSNTGSLCLYHPSNFHWSAGRLIANEIVPWTAAWIYFYEIWLRKGRWFGPEVLHSGPTKSN